MTKQQDNTTRDYSQFSKTKAIKEIEKLTGLKYEQNNSTYLFFGGKDDYGDYTSIEIDKNELWCQSEFGLSRKISTKWLEPLSKLIPILFKESE